MEHTQVLREGLAILDIRKYLSWQYEHKGRREGFVDCYGFIILFYKNEVGKELFDVNEDYDKKWAFKNKNYFIENYHRQFEKVEKPGRYDIVGFHNRQNIVNHAGIVLGYGKFVHCCKDGVLVDSYNREGWRKRLNGFYKLK